AGIYSLLQYRASAHGIEHENSSGSGAKLLIRKHGASFLGQVNLEYKKHALKAYFLYVLCVLKRVTGIEPV
ncbi:MAG TPA: hypothetical protein VJI33_01540, partial [Candidatus Paceibacterota bacterium]